MVPPQQDFFNAVGSVDYVPQAYVYLQWSGAPPSSPEFRASYVHARHLMERHQLMAILADHHAMPDSPDGADRE